MNIKPKEVFLDLPQVLTFRDYHEIPQMASHINTFIHGKVKVKYEELGNLAEQYVGIFYLQRNDEYQELRNEFMELINQEEMQQ